MGLITEEVNIRVNGSNINYYRNKGYKIPLKDNQKTDFSQYIVVKVEDLPKGSGVIVEAECDCCHKRSNVHYNNYCNTIHDGKHYCRECSLAILNSKELNKNWNPNLTDEDRNDRRKTKEYKIFVQCVLARDEYTCQFCKQNKNRNLEVHHLDSYNWCKDRRLDVSNGITLCKNCHKNFHIKYGQGNNTKEQFIEWMGKSYHQLEQYNGELPIARQIYDFTEDKIYDSAILWAEIHKSNESFVYTCCNHSEMYRTIKKKDGSNTIHTIHNNTVHGHYLLWYDEYKNMTKEDIGNYFYQHRNRTYIAVICITTNKRFDTIMEASKYYKVNRSGIKDCCAGKRQTCGEDSNGIKLQWMFLSDFEKLSQEEQKQILNKEKGDD